MTDMIGKSTVTNRHMITAGQIQRFQRKTRLKRWELWLGRVWVVGQQRLELTGVTIAENESTTHRTHRTHRQTDNRNRWTIRSKVPCVLCVLCVGGFIFRSWLWQDEAADGMNWMKKNVKKWWLEQYTKRAHTLRRRYYWMRTWLVCRWADKSHVTGSDPY